MVATAGGLILVETAGALSSFHNQIKDATLSGGYPRIILSKIHSHKFWFFFCIFRSHCNQRARRKNPQPEIDQTPPGIRQTDERFGVTLPQENR